MGRIRNRWSFATAKSKKTRMDTKTFHTSSAQCQFLLKAFSFSIKLSALTGIFCLHLFIRRLYFPQNAISPAVSGFVFGGVYASNTPLETLQIKNGAMTNALRAANLLQKANLKPVWIRRGDIYRFDFLSTSSYGRQEPAQGSLVVSTMTFWSHLENVGFGRNVLNYPDISTDSRKTLCSNRLKWRSSKSRAVSVQQIRTTAKATNT